MAAFKPYLPQRFVHPGPIVLFYPYGNYPADDLLEHVHFEDEREPAILELGCGDIGSCLYTLWKHFDSAASGRHFFGAQFFLNDKSGASLARNILFLYLAVKIPPWTELESAKQWIASMWAIWYCHELLPAHEQLLREALDALLSFSGTVESWKSSAENPLRKVVRLTDQLTLNKITAAWRLWRTFSFGSVQEVQKHRYSKVPHIGEDNMSPCVMSISPWLQATHGPTVTAVMYEAMNHEYTRYIETGNVFAEPCLDLPCIDHQSIVNPTLFEREDKIYSLDFTCLPFENFHHGFVVSKAIFQKAGLSLNAAGQPLVIEDDSFEQSPMLSNCIQQFSIWVSSTAVTLNSSSLSANPSVAFTLNCSECIHFCEEVQHNPQQFYRRTGIKPAFDAIYTSNLIDKLTPPVLVTAAAPLLKKNGCLLTTPFLYRCCAASAEEYLQDTFGFSPEYLPLIAGVRCIGHDGRYFSGTSALPTPVYGIESVLADFQCSRYDKLLIWQKVDAWPLKVPATGISVKTAICQTLHRSLRNASRRFYGKYPTIQGYHTRAALCTETALMNVLSFVSRLDAEVDITSYLFWEGLCSLLKEDTSLNRFYLRYRRYLCSTGYTFTSWWIPPTARSVSSSLSRKLSRITLLRLISIGSSGLHNTTLRMVMFQPSLSSSTKCQYRSEFTPLIIITRRTRRRFNSGSSDVW